MEQKEKETETEREGGKRGREKERESQIFKERRAGERQGRGGEDIFVTCEHTHTHTQTTCTDAFIYPILISLSFLVSKKFHCFSTMTTKDV